MCPWIRVRLDPGSGGSRAHLDPEYAYIFPENSSKPVWIPAIMDLREELTRLLQPQMAVAPRDGGWSSRLVSSPPLSKEQQMYKQPVPTSQRRQNCCKKHPPEEPLPTEKQPLLQLPEELPPRVIAATQGAAFSCLNT
ncbi:hypothetical protein QTO34_000672 [Cnephaeus nilssonii]|uniref:Uncharacterized protein n=1 Tax=Cnephaeus nilssonii TaxID=3371016 RepID=A0AA40ICV5_CNENI|nr:hypothetical protein QTO34_000672 [Eptesicus nilssonii]